MGSSVHHCGKNVTVGMFFFDNAEGHTTSAKSFDSETHIIMGWRAMGTDEEEELGLLAEFAPDVGPEPRCVQSIFFLCKLVNEA